MSNNFVIHLAVPHPTRHTSQKHLLFGIVVAGGDVFISALSAGAIESRNNDPFICVCVLYMCVTIGYTHTRCTHIYTLRILWIWIMADLLFNEIGTYIIFNRINGFGPCVCVCLCASNKNKKRMPRTVHIKMYNINDMAMNFGCCYFLHANDLIWCTIFPLLFYLGRL